MVAEVVTQRAQERSKRGDVFENRRPQPNADQSRFRIVVAEQFRSPASFAHPERPRCKYLDRRLTYPIEIGGGSYQLRTSSPHRCAIFVLHRGLDGPGWHYQAIVRWQFKLNEPVALVKLYRDRWLLWRPFSKDF